jgi:uncharacterized protein YbjT (DUF2867 family)
MKALVIGATGLVGSEMVHQLLENPKISSVETFGRRKSEITHAKLTQHIVDFKNPDSWKNLVKGDLALSALGTTKAAAGSIQAQYEVDYTYQANFAKTCADNGVPTFVLISSLGASSKSSVPYSKMKGELEEYVNTLKFKNLFILQPGPLEGPRVEYRPLEKILNPAIKVLSHLPGLKTYHPVHCKKVAATAIAAGMKDHGKKVIKAIDILNFQA